MDECINELARKLNSLAEAGSRNRILPDQLQEWVLEYLRDWDEEVGRFPELGRERHWNLWMADCDFDKEAFFVGMIFGPTEIEVLYGRGESHSVRTFCENEFPEDLDKVIPQMKRRFRVSAIDAITRGQAESWLGRPFPPDANS